LLENPPELSTVTFFEAKGCDKCSGTGYSGRKAIYEVYRITGAMREIIYRYGGDIGRLRQAAEESGMWNMRASGFRKVLAGLTTIDEVMSVTVAD
jgi:type II secretory ATPase GspE/PulE/Tfp pilus assembly ATPase PilB-like protein